MKRLLVALVLGGLAVASVGAMLAARPDLASLAHWNNGHAWGDAPAVEFRSVKGDGLDIAHREAGPKDAPVILIMPRFDERDYSLDNQAALAKFLRIDATKWQYTHGAAMSRASARPRVPSHRSAISATSTLRCSTPATLRSKR